MPISHQLKVVAPSGECLRGEGRRWCVCTHCLCDPCL